MHYPEFETAFEARLQTCTDLYPHAVAYHRARFDQTIQYFVWNATTRNTLPDSQMSSHSTPRMLTTAASR